MKFNALTFLLCFASALPAFARSAEPKTVPYVNLAQYVGDWYEISHVPLFFEGRGRCVCTRQRLAPMDNGLVSVYNSCNKNDPNGEIRDIRGTAQNDDPQSNAKFTVDFNLGRKGTYWIVGLDSQYRYAVVTDKYAYSLYILSKTPTLDAALYQEALQIAEAQNLKTDKLEMTSQVDCHYPQ